ncbi:MAG: sugar phosphate isomerase/epimerase family protein [Bacteroidota bacterium]|nr:sugar phosphate isomerase/epimerase family protein [Bacteroidota bacterium]
MISRLHQLKQLFSLLIVCAMAFSFSSGKCYAQVAKKQDITFKIGMAGYTFKDISIDKTIEMMKRINVNYLSIKDIQLPLKSTQEEITAVKTKFANAGITIYTGGVIYMKTKEAVDQAFDYGKKLGVDMLVCAPDYQLLGYVEQKVKETNIRVAIHNHGPDNPLYPNATDIWNHIKDMDPRMGICIDIGHTTRDGQDPTVDIKRYFKRIFDIHIKDETVAAKEGKTCEMGRGVIDIPKFVSTLKSLKYTGVCGLEFEKDSKDPLPGVAESIGYFRGVIACTK